MDGFSGEPAVDRKDVGSLDIIGNSLSVKRLADTPVKTEIISREQMLKTHATDLVDALRYVPGLQLKEIHGKSGTEIWMQGYDADRVLVLIDGDPVSPSTGTAVDISQIAIGDVQRIEITKGAVSALYGAAAMGGVVNIITREPEASQTAGLELSAGSWGSQNNRGPVAREHGRLELSGRGRRGYWQLVADARFSDGFKATDEGQATQGWEGHKANLSGKFSIDLTDKTRLKLMPRLFHEDARTIIENFVPGVGDLPENKIDKTSRSHLAAVLTHEQNADSLWTFRLMYEDFGNEALQDLIATPEKVEKNRESRLELGGAEIRYEKTLNDTHTITVGAEYEFGKMNVSLTTDDVITVDEVADETSRSSQFYLQDSWFVRDNLEVMPGVRVHQSAGFGSYVSPMLSVLYSQNDWLPGELSYRAGIGNGYRTPSLKEQHYIFDHSHLGYKIIGNPDLDPESSISYQAGVEWVSPDNTLLELSVFRNDSRDLIETSLDPEASAESGLSIYNYQNIDKTRSTGFEGLYRVPWNPLVSTSLSYTFLEAKNLSTGRMLVRRPKHELKLGLDLQLTDSIGLVLRLNTQSKEYLDEENTRTSPGFSTLDIKLNHTLGSEWQIFGGVNNLTDVQRDFTGEDFRPVEGRYVYAGFRFNTSRP
ncbi:MAG: TonB-dependent receptor [Gammaproteobacteria bacterium]|nr:TonB-dependent receptor [Gammaproteobacteria bacterium]